MEGVQVWRCSADISEKEKMWKYTSDLLENVSGWKNPIQSFEKNSAPLS